VVDVGGEGRPVIDGQTFDAMVDVMVHRGPNDRGVFARPGIALGVRRLSIVDVEAGHQPVSNEDGSVWAVQNGELYNHLDLRAELSGHRFASRCDTEIIPHLYERDSERFCEQLWGKFGIAVWDERRRRLVLARDRLGVKPLYYARSGDLLVFASELKSVLASGLVSTELDYEAIDAYLTLGFFPGPMTPLAGVSKLLPGHRLVVGDGEVRTQRYWAYPEPNADSPPLSEQEYSQGLLEQLEDAVRRRLMSDVPLGAMLSGGLDSSLIVALMARNMSEPVKTFSVGFIEDDDSNELADARLVAEHFATDHHELELSIHDNPIDLNELVWHLDEPLADLSALGFQALSQLAAQHVTVALSGQGADELLGGYKKHRAAALIERVPARAGRLVGGIMASAPGSRASAFARFGRTLAAASPVERALEMGSLLKPEIRRELYGPRLVGATGKSASRVITSLLAGGAPDEPLATTLYVDAQLALPDDLLHYFDRASMAHSLEARVPFLDHLLVQYCATIPTHLKVRRFQGKYILRRAARGLVPDHTIRKRKVGFFRGASKSWVEAQLRGELRGRLLDPGARTADILDQRSVSAFLEAKATADSARFQIALLMLELWLSEYLPRAAARPPQPVAVSTA
jgi:asparagine synthase (glutamine-hydrolysing)